MPKLKGGASAEGVIVTAGSEEDLAYCRSLGAARAVNYKMAEAAHAHQLLEDSQRGLIKLSGKVVLTV